MKTLHGLILSFEVSVTETEWNRVLPVGRVGVNLHDATHVSFLPHRVLCFVRYSPAMSIVAGRDKGGRFSVVTERKYFAVYGSVLITRELVGISPIADPIL